MWVCRPALGKVFGKGRAVSDTDMLADPHCRNIWNLCYKSLDTLHQRLSKESAKERQHVVNHER